MQLSLAGGEQALQPPVHADDHAGRTLTGFRFDGHQVQVDRTVPVDSGLQVVGRLFVAVEGVLVHAGVDGQRDADGVPLVQGGHDGPVLEVKRVHGGSDACDLAVHAHGPAAPHIREGDSFAQMFDDAPRHLVRVIGDGLPPCVTQVDPV